MEETLRKITELSSIQSQELSKFKDVTEYEICLLHIEKHINAAILLYNNGFFEQSTFLIITILEEISKAEICVYRGFGKDKESVRRNKDGLFNHKSKHLAIANDITFKYLKTKKKYGAELTDEILKNLKEGYYINIRENALYFKNINGKCIVSDKAINSESTKVLLLICLEIFEDRLFGFSNKTDIITDRVLSRYDEIK
ncbi:MAG: AbiV family abortive infection protein [Flavobacteriaceae bacterium]|jgi:AbiV family abortive infection protein|nr:AbiV family abortive infection protein [Flavobacteriaceae bacterium]